MAEIWLWNSLTTRRRAATDTVKEVGLNIIKTYLEKHKHQAKVIDWVGPVFYQSLSPQFLVKWNRFILKQLFKGVKRGKKSVVLGGLFLFIQSILSNIQNKRMQCKLEALVKEIISSQVKNFGIKVWYGEAFSWSKKLVRMLKERAPDILTIAGGYHATLYEEDILKYSDFDLGVVCEGEFALKEILDIADEFKTSWNKAEILSRIIEKAENNEIENLIYRKDGQIKRTGRYDYTKTEKTIPDYEEDHKIKLHVVIESLGCDWAKCNFCVHPYFYQRYFMRPIEGIIAELEAMTKKGIGLFRFAGSDTPPFFGAKIAQGILDKGLKIEYSVGSRGIRGAKNAETYARLVESYSLMIKSGLRAVFMGGECGNEFINNEVMNKGVSYEDLIWSTKALREAEKNCGQKVDLSLALIYPVPLLNKVSLKEVFADNLRLIKAISPDSVMVTPPGPFKNTQWNLRKEEFGFSFSDDIIPRAMEYEYVLYKPTRLWPEFGISLEGRPFKKVLEECSTLRKEIEEKLSIPTDLTDEEFILARAAGYQGKEGALKFKEESLLDIISCDYTFINSTSKKLNAYSSSLT